MESEMTLKEEILQHDETLLPIEPIESSRLIEKEIIEEESSLFAESIAMVESILVESSLMRKHRLEEYQLERIRLYKSPLVSLMYCFLDLETDSLNIREARIIEYGIECYKFSDEFEKMQRLSSLGNLVLPFENFIVDSKATEVNHITSEMLVGKHDLSCFYDSIKLWIEKCDVIVAHNVSFDLNILINECFRIERMDNQRYYGLSNLLRKKLTLDTLVVSRRVVTPEAGVLGNYKLVNLCSRVGISVFNAHRALQDVKATVLLFQKMFIAISKFGRYKKMVQTAPNIENPPVKKKLRTWADFNKVVTKEQFCSTFIDSKVITIEDLENFLKQEKTYLM